MSYSDFVALDPSQLLTLQNILKNLPPEAQDACVQAAAEYLINVYQAYPPQAHIPRGVAYPEAQLQTKNGVLKGYFSWAQFRKVMALVAEGAIPYRRTQELRNNWKIIGSGASIIIANETPYAALMMGRGEQARMSTLGGWKDVETIAVERGEEIERRGVAAINKTIEKLGAK